MVSLLRSGLVVLAFSLVLGAQVLTVPNGGTGGNTLTPHGPLVGQGNAPITAITPGASGQCFVSGGPGVDPVFATCPGGGYNVPANYPTIQAAVNAACAANGGPVTVSPNATDMTPYSNSCMVKVIDYRQNAGIDSSTAYRNAKEWGVKTDAVQVGCVFTAGSSTMVCSNANFKPTDVGKTIICYGCGPPGTSAVSTYTAGYYYVSGGTAPVGFPSGDQYQYIEALNGGPSGAACATPPAGSMHIHNGVPASEWVTLYWSGDGCVTPPTTWQIAGFTGTSTFTGGTLGNQTMITTVASVTNSTTVVMANAAASSSLGGSNPVSQIVYCSDDTVAWNNLTTAFSGNQGNAHITFTGGSCISNTISFLNWSGELSGSGKGNSEIGFANGLGSYFFWASNTPGGVMIDNAGGSGMKFSNFTLVGNSTAPPIGIQLSAFQNSNQLVGAANAIEGVNFGLNRGSDPNSLNYTGYWPILTGIKAHTYQGNADFQRLCWGSGCSFFNVKYPVDKDSDQATGYQWGTLRTFYARDGFCAVGSDQIQEYEGAFNQTDVHLGSCQYQPGQSAIYGNVVFQNLSSDGDPQLLEMGYGEGSVEFVHGLWGYSFIKNNGIVVNAQSPANNGSIILGPLFKIQGAAGYTGFPPVQAIVNQPAQNIYGQTAIFNNLDAAWFPLSNYPPQSLSNQYMAVLPFTFTNMTPDGRSFDIHGFPIGADYVDLFHHHYWYDTAGITEGYGTTLAKRLSPPIISAQQIPGATAGSTTYQYAGQCRLNNWGTNNGSIGSYVYYPSALTTGAATLTPANANGIFMQWYVLGCDGYYIYLNVGGTYKCLAKSGACVEFTTKTAAGYIAVDDGSYSYLTAPDRDGSGMFGADNGIQIGGKDFAGFKPSGTGPGTPQLADFSTLQAADGLFPIYNFAQKQYVPGTNVPQSPGMVSAVGGALYTSGYTTIGSLVNYGSPGVISLTAFTPTAASRIADGKVYIGTFATGVVYWAVYDSDGVDNTGAGNAPGTLLCSDQTGVPVTVTSAWMTATTVLKSNCPVFSSGHKYFWGVSFTLSPGASTAYDSTVFSGTSYFGNFVGGYFPPFFTVGASQNTNIVSMYVDLTTVYTLQAVSVVPANYLGTGSDGSGTHCLKDNQTWAGCGTGGSMTWPSGSAGIPNYSGSSSWGTSYNASNLVPATFLSPVTNIAGGVVGSLPYQSAASTTAFLVGNTAATDQVVTSRGTGSAAQAPTLKNAPALSAANMTSFPVLNQNTTGTAAGITGNGTAGQVWGMNLAGTSQGWQPSGPLYEQTFLNESELSTAGPINLSGGSATECSSSTPFVCTISTPAADTSYRMTVQITQTSVGSGPCTGGGTLQFWLSYTDPDSLVALSNQPIAAINVGGTTFATNMTMSPTTLAAATQFNLNPLTIRVKNGTSLQYRIQQSVATTGCTTQPTFTVRIAFWPGN